MAGSDPGVPPPYQPHPHHFPPYGYQPPRTNSNAVAAMIVSIASLFVCPIIGCVGIYLGSRARREISQTGEQGDGMALAGVIVGWIAVGLGVLSVLLVVVWLVFVVGMAASISAT